MQVLAADAPSGSGELLIMMIYLFTREGGTKYKKPLKRLSKRRGRMRSKIEFQLQNLEPGLRCNCFPILRLRSCFEGAYKISGRKSGAIEK
ncbi:hypothetical protein ES319_A03G129800v1 [Gossypium barbadense]|uniref:Uncharacterized protein n=1 Tax=Gossypium barbadense TaxID=3634 RepID=A0A5J5WCZ3_GOSBA|nr:hypothetical protein ES319_A03G129800v1 [Gossypium barbadense]